MQMRTRNAASKAQSHVQYGVQTYVPWTENTDEHRQMIDPLNTVLTTS